MSKKKKTPQLDLTSVTHWAGCGPAKQKVTSSVPLQGTCLGCRFLPQLEACTGGNQLIFLSHIRVSLSLSPLYLKINKILKKKNPKTKTPKVWKLCWTLLNCLWCCREGKIIFPLHFYILGCELPPHNKRHINRRKVNSLYYAYLLYTRDKPRNTE